MTMAALPPGGSAAAPQTDAERRFFAEEQEPYIRDDAAHRGIHGTKFQTLAFALEDSPVALMAWLVDKWWILADIMREDERPRGGDLYRRFTKDELLATVAIYWFTRTQSSAMRIYHEAMRPPAEIEAEIGGQVRLRDGERTERADRFYQAQAGHASATTLVVRARVQRRSLDRVPRGRSFPGDGSARPAARRHPRVLRLMPVVRHHLRCLDCGALAPASLDISCERCGGLYEIDYPRLPEGGIRLPLTALPLGQGGTPTISFDWPDALRLRLELKLEYLSPTGSFKDRGAAMLVSAAWSGGASAFVEDSSGNAGAALAAYAAAARMSAEIFVPADAPETKQAQIAAVGAQHSCYRR